VTARDAGAGVVGADSDPATILILDPDPYLVFLAEKEFPEARVVVSAGEESEPTEVSTDDAGLIIARADDPRVESLDRSGDTKLVIVADTRQTGEVDPSELPSADGVLLRPFTPAELSRTVRAAVGSGRWDRPRHRQPLVWRLRRWLGPLRVAAVAFAAVLELSQPATPQTAAILLAAAFGYVALRMVVRLARPFAIWMDVAVAAVLIALTGGMASSYGIFGVVVAMEVGLLLGRRQAIIAGLVIASGTVPQVVEMVIADAALPITALGLWLTLFPLAGLAAALGSSLWARSEREGVHLIAEANRVLSHLYDIARAIPAGFEAGSVATAALDEARESTGASAGLVLIEEVGLLSVAGAYGVDVPMNAVFDADKFVSLLTGETTIADPRDFPFALGSQLDGEDRWLVAPLRHGGVALGLLLLAGGLTERRSYPVVEQTQRLADEAALALTNARLFSRVRELSVDEERRRLAAELHDGIAQVLAHVRLELDLLAAQEAIAPDVREEAQRLGRVVQRGLQDVRSTISGLRSSVSSEGLSAALRNYTRDLQGLGGPVVRCRSRLPVPLDGEVEAELFRVAQEAISNALRHSGASTVDVVLETRNGDVRLVIEDDGNGLQAVSATGAGSGLGLKAMSERAERIGASLTVTGRRNEPGTRVSLVYPGEAQQSGR
jgi:signal transduction histidine kinase